jgi:hypothetical protein
MNINTYFLKSYVAAETIWEHRLTRIGRLALLIVSCYALYDCGYAAVEADMKAAVEGLQKEIFGNGWVTVAKIGAGATGVVMSIAKMSPVPFVMGGLASGGIHFFQKSTEAAAGLLF